MSAAATPFYVTGGTLRPGAPSYVERQADRVLYEGLMQGEFCYVLTARQMGKSSLMVHTAAGLREEGGAVAVLDLTAIGQNLSPEQWYDGLRDVVGTQLELEDELDDFWLEHTRLGPLQRWMAALREVVLARVPGRVVIFVDEIDAVRSLPFSTDEFFAAVRECYNRRSQEPEFGRLTFCLLGVATPSDLIQDTRTTPFNIGKRIELTDFTAAEAAPLAQGLGRDPKTNQALLQRVLYWTGGHPYLTQRLCRTVAEDRNVIDTAGVDRLCEALFLSPSAQEQDDNLLFVRERLLKSEVDRAALLDLYRQVRSGKRVRLDDTNQLVSLLRLSGITRVAEGSLRVRNRIYERVFDPRWVTQHMPDAELRRQRAAFRQGLLRATAVSGVVLTAMGALALTAVNQARRADQQRRVADQQRLEARHNLYASQMNLAQQSWEQSDPARTLELLEAWRPEPGQEDLRGFEWRYLWRLCQDTQGLILKGHGSGVYAVAFSPDGRSMASGGNDWTVKLWDLAGKRVEASLPGHAARVTCVAFAPNGQLLASSSFDKTVKLWDLVTKRNVATFGGHTDAPSPSKMCSVAFSPDGRILASGCGDSTIKLWNIAGYLQKAGHPRSGWGRAVATLRGHGNEVWAVAFSPDGKTLASGSIDSTVKLWDLASRREVVTLKGHRGWVESVAFSPDAKTLASASETVKLWDLASKQEVATLTGHRSRADSVAFSPNGKTLATASLDRTVKLWDLATRQEMTTLGGHTGWVYSVAFSPDGKTLATGSGDRTVRLWKPAATRDRPLSRGNALITGIAFSPDGRTLAIGNQSADAEGGGWTVELWAVTPRRRIAILQGHTAIVHSVAFSPDGQTLASSSDDRTAKLWDVASRRLIASLPGSVGGYQRLAFSRDGKTLAIGTGEGPVQLWDVASRREIAVLKGHKEPVFGLAFSPNGQILASGSYEPSGAKLWDVVSRREIHLKGGAFGAGPVFAFSADSKTLIAGGGGSTLKLWDLTTGRAMAALQKSTAGIFTVALSPDGKTLAASGANEITLWNVPIRQPVATLKGHTGAVYVLAFASDGNTLASGGADGTVRLWRAATLHEGDPLRLASLSSSDRAVTLRWRPVPAALGYNVYRGPAGAGRAPLVKLNTQPLTGATFTDHGPDLVNGRAQTYRLATVFRSSQGQAEEAGPGPGQVTFTATPVAVPPGWLGCSIDEGARTGGVLFAVPSAAITLRGSGADLWDVADGCYFLNQPVTGDFQLTVRALTTPTSTDPGARAGLMLRESLDPGARNVCLATTSGHGLIVQWRPTNGGSTEAPADSVIDRDRLRLPITLRLARQGDTITSTYSTDGGRSFYRAGDPPPFYPPLAKTLSVGLAISAHNSSTMSEASFSGLEIQKR